MKRLFFANWLVLNSKVVMTVDAALYVLYVLCENLDLVTRKASIIPVTPNVLCFVKNMPCFVTMARIRDSGQVEYENRDAVLPPSQGENKRPY